MESGTIVESGSHEELLESGGIYKQLYSLQFDDSAVEQFMGESSVLMERPL